MPMTLREAQICLVTLGTILGSPENMEIIQAVNRGIDRQIRAAMAGALDHERDDGDTIVRGTE